MKKLTIIVKEGQHTCDIELNGFAPDTRLTPILARAALRAYGVSVGDVYDTIPRDGKLPGYRVFPNSVKKLVK